MGSGFSTKNGEEMHAMVQIHGGAVDTKKGQAGG